MERKITDEYIQCSRALQSYANTIEIGIGMIATLGYMRELTFNLEEGERKTAALNNLAKFEKQSENLIEFLFARYILILDELFIQNKLKITEESFNESVEYFRDEFNKEFKDRDIDLMFANLIDISLECTYENLDVDKIPTFFTNHNIDIEKEYANITTYLDQLDDMAVYLTMEFGEEAQEHNKYNLRYDHIVTPLHNYLLAMISVRYKLAVLPQDESQTEDIKNRAIVWLDSFGDEIDAIINDTVNVSHISPNESIMRAFKKRIQKLNEKDRREPRKMIPDTHNFILQELEKYNWTMEVTVMPGKLSKSENGWLTNLIYVLRGNNADGIEFTYIRRRSTFYDEVANSSMLIFAMNDMFQDVANIINENQETVELTDKAINTYLLGILASHPLSIDGGENVTDMSIALDQILESEEVPNEYKDLVYKVQEGIATKEEIDKLIEYALANMVDIEAFKKEKELEKEKIIYN